MHKFLQKCLFCPWRNLRYNAWCCLRWSIFLCVYVPMGVRLKGVGRESRAKWTPFVWKKKKASIIVDSPFWSFKVEKKKRIKLSLNIERSSRSPGAKKKFKKSEVAISRSALILSFCENLFFVYCNLLKPKFGEAGCRFQHFWVSKVIATVNAHKVVLFFMFFKELSNKQN